MSPRPRASERARLAALALTACALGAGCRQTVMLDTAEDAGAAGFGGTAGTGADLDGGGSGDHNGGGGVFGGSHFDGGRPDGLAFCQFQSVPITMRSPYIIFSVDRSSDMQTWFGTGTRLDIIQQQVQGLVQKYRFVRFGYQEFPAPMGMCGTQGCCAGDVTLPTFNYTSTKAIRQAIHACDNGAVSCNQPQRPIADAMSKIFNAYKTIDPGLGPDDKAHRYVVLFTSGDATCQDPTSMSTPCDDAVAQVTKLANTFTNTSVFGVGDGTSSRCLDQLALFGGLDTSHIVKTANDLSSSLGTVVETMAEAACTIDLASQPPDLKTVQVLFDSVPVPNDPTNGWTFDQADPGTTTTSLTVHGSSCHALEQNVSHIDVVAGCALPHN